MLFSQSEGRKFKPTRDTLFESCWTLRNASFSFWFTWYIFISKSLLSFWCVNYLFDILCFLTCFLYFYRSVTEELKCKKAGRAFVQWIYENRQLNRNPFFSSSNSILYCIYTHTHTQYTVYVRHKLIIRKIDQKKHYRLLS